MWWRRCSSSRPPQCTTPAGSSGRESLKPRQDKVWRQLSNVHLIGKSTPSPACHVSLSASDYGLFLSDDDPRKGIWLESGRTLDYYMLRNGVRKKMNDEGLLVPVCFPAWCKVLPFFLRMFWNTRRSSGHRRSKCWTVRLKPLWWTTQRQSGSCLSPYAAESVFDCMK